jgi:alpha-glucosidase
MNEPRWWQRGIVYQVYPRSFQDSDGDGIGDLAGIRARLDYLVDLGVDAVWISPIYPSPMKDFGYDITDFTDIHPMFGTLEEFDRLVAAAHERGLKLILDLVPNHTSDQHLWFREARSSRDNPKRDWFIWHDPKPDGSPPNNWLSVFGGSAWTWDEATGQYYYHTYLREQPELNWRNPDVVAALHGVMRFWLDRGVDGFRVDVIWRLIKDDQFRDNPPNPVPPEARVDRAPHRDLIPFYTADRPEVHTVIAGLRRVVDAYDDRVLIGEIYLPPDRLVAYYGRDLEGAHLPFNFALIETPWNARGLAELIDGYERALPEGGWPNWVLGNHDKPRIASRVGPAQARVAAMLLLTVRGTPTLYYGDELGMADVAIPPDRVQDPFEKNVPGRGLGRDPVRTPMQWDDTPNAGFTTGTPWLPLSADWEVVNVAAERTDPDSMLTLHRRLIALRRREAALAAGNYAPVAVSGDLLAYIRERHGRRFLVALNLGDQPYVLELPDDLGQGRIVLSTHLDREGESLGGELALRSDEGIVAELEPEVTPS